MRCFLTVAAPRACTPLPLKALATSCRLARCWLYTREPEAAAASDRAHEAWKVGFTGMPPGRPPNLPAQRMRQQATRCREAKFCQSHSMKQTGSRGIEAPKERAWLVSSDRSLAQAGPRETCDLNPQSVRCHPSRSREYTPWIKA